MEIDYIIPDHQSSIINHQSSIINHQSSIINHQSSIINHQSSIINHQSSNGVKSSNSCQNYIHMTKITMEDKMDKLHRNKGVCFGV